MRNLVVINVIYADTLAPKNGYWRDMSLQFMTKVVPAKSFAAIAHQKMFRKIHIETSHVGIGGNIVLGKDV